MEMVKMFNSFLQTEDGKILFLLGLISITMIIDFITGVAAAKIQNNFRSKEGINGIIRKLCSVLLLIVFVPFALIIPGNIGIALVYVLYVGYEIMELKSIIENLKKMGSDTAIFDKFIDEAEKKINGK